MLEVVTKAVGELIRQKSVQKRLAKFLVHPVTLLAIATMFATLAGVWLTQYYQSQAWIRDKQFEVFRQGYREALELVDELSDVMSRRFFGLNRVVWAAKGTGTGELEQVWEEYYQTVVEWNTKIMSYQHRLVRSVDEDTALRLGSWDDTHATHPRTTHDFFFQAHERVRALVDCVRNRCTGEAKATALQDAEQAVNTLGLVIQAFIQHCNVTIHERTTLP